MTEQSLIVAVFWVSALAVIWPHVLYPVSLILFPRRTYKTGSQILNVSLLISAFNEEAVIGEKLDNVLSLDYPRDHLETIVVSDCSTDRTDDIVRTYAGQEIRLLRLEDRLGKSAGINRAIENASGEIIVFSDANSMYEPDAITCLVRHFVDPSIGYVVGHQRYAAESGGAADSESIYWRFETWIKTQESRVGSVVGGDGAIYAIRASCFEPLRHDDISDFTLPLKLVVRGFRGVFDPRAVCVERPAGQFESELRRKVRIVTRSCRAVMRVPQALNPFCVGLFAYELASHKVLRWLGPVFLIALAAATIPLAATGHPVYVAGACLQVVLYLAAGAGVIPGLSHYRLFYVPFYFVLMNVAAAAGILGAMFGYRYTVWTPERRFTDRTDVLDPERSGKIGI